MTEVLKHFWLLSLSFKSSLHIGKGSSDTFMGATQIVKNGAGNYVIPGTSIAGVFISTLMNCVVPDDPENKLWKELTGANKQGNEDPEASHLVFRSVEIQPETLEIKDRVSINRKTKTAKEGAKFSAWEVLPEDLQVLIEFDNMSKQSSLDKDDCELIQSWVNAVLFSWHKEGFFLGGNTGTGNGHVQLKQVQQCSLDSTNLPAYLDASYHDLPQVDMGWSKYEPSIPSIGCRDAFTRKYRLKLSVGYQNPLLIKGGISYLSHENPETDASFIHRKGIPYIPGSSIRGAISSFMDKYSQTAWKSLLGQPKDNKDAPEEGGSIIFSDLKLQDADANAWCLKQIERHAEDQFSRAIFGSGKFDEERLFNAEFKGEIIVLRDMPITVEELDKLFDFLNSGFQHDMISLGTGACYPKITLEEIK